VKYTYEYLPWRGVTKEVMKFYDCKTKIDAEGVPVSLGFKYPNGAHKVRRLDAKEFYTSGEINKEGLFGTDRFAAGSHKYVTITEGELDALSLYQAIRAPVVSVHSATSALRDCTHSRSWLGSFERVYLCFDNDAAGRDATRAVARLFEFNKVFVVPLAPRKDPNDWLGTPDGANELRNIWENAKRYLPDNIVSRREDFHAILRGGNAWGVPYPWSKLTEMTYGIRKGESVLITAQEKVGKTELMHFIEHQLLRETDANIGAIYLEEPKRRHLQALAGISLGAPVHLPDCSYSEDKIISAVDALVGRDDRLFVYASFGSLDPDLLVDTIRVLAAGYQCDYILLDHISMVVSGNSGVDERQTLDYLSTKLEMLVKELNIALILVSHVNDEGKTRGSRYISKVCDIRIDATRDQQHTDPIERCTIHLNVAYNRFSGATGPAGKIIFDLPTYSFKQVNDLLTKEERDNEEETQRLLPSSTLPPQREEAVQEIIQKALSGGAATFERQEEQLRLLRESVGVSPTIEGEGKKEVEACVAV